MTSTHQSSLNRPNDTCQASKSRTEDSKCWLSKIHCQLDLLRRRQPHVQRVFPRLPQTSQERRDASLLESHHVAQSLTHSDISAAEEKGKSVLYLAYGSNLCNETFRGVRGIKPLSQINVVVPSLRLTFDLP